ncbi:MAG: LacI family transcriptional regulator [Clostridia bacterium]|nr:LacI family transcriptional regulator [Clostridia bacterium]NCC45023.1 LacI family transcriptional regulator [Clostridia bacterium]
MAATIKDIAKKTGLGLATISSYLNGGNVREKNRIKIEQAIEELHFEVNEVARGLRTNLTKTIGVVIPELNMVFCAEIITAMEDILRNHGYATIVCDCRTDQKREQEAVEFLMHKRVDGLINMPVDKTGGHLKAYQRMGKPLVLIDREIEDMACDNILVDNQMAAAQAVDLFIEQGHKNIGLVVGPQSISAARERCIGYKNALSKAGIKVQEDYIYYGKDDMNSGVEGIKKLHRDHPEITGVFVANHAMTIGAVIGLNEENIQMGEELSLVGFDNRQFARACNPQLTIVAQPTKEIAKDAAERILAYLNGAPRKDHTVEKIKTRVIMGKSIKSLNKE